MIPPPPTSPLFPYTTLFRSRRSRRAATHRPPRSRRASISRERWARPRRRATPTPPPLRKARRPRNVRSEEHTSELQSLTNLVCRLLLEKKKDTHNKDVTVRQ